MTLPVRLTAGIARDPALSIIAAPAEIDAMTYQMSWHPRPDHDPAHQWLRTIITTTVIPADV